MNTTHQDLLQKWARQRKGHTYIIGVSCGSGLAARQAERGGADMILALNSARFRQMGHGSLAGFLPFLNSNRLVMEFGTRELVPSIHTIPVLFGLCATDPTIQLEQFLQQIQRAGFFGINNYPTVGLIDGRFRDAIESQGLCFDLEVEAMRLAHGMGLFTLAYVFTPEQAEQMLYAGADVICLHMGLTKGGLLGAKKVLSLESAAGLARQVFAVCDRLRPGILKLVYGGPITSPTDAEYMYNNTGADGYIGGSTFDRTPSEQMLWERTRQFKLAGQLENDKLMAQMLMGVEKNYDYVDFVKEYVAANYGSKILFSDLAAVIHVSRSHLSALFHREVGCTFPAYLMNYRIHKAAEILAREKLPCAKVAELVGFSDYAHFSKVFKQVMGVSPSAYTAQKKPGL